MRKINFSNAFLFSSFCEDFEINCESFMKQCKKRYNIEITYEEAERELMRINDELDFILISYSCI